MCERCLGCSRGAGQGGGGCTPLRNWSWSLNDQPGAWESGKASFRVSFWLLCCSHVSGDCQSNCRQSRNVGGNGSPQTARSEGSVVLGLRRRAGFSLRHCQIRGVLSVCAGKPVRLPGTEGTRQRWGTLSRGSLHAERQTYPVCHLMCFISKGAKNVLQCHVNTCTHIRTPQAKPILCSLHKH